MGGLSQTNDRTINRYFFPRLSCPPDLRNCTDKLHLPVSSINKIDDLNEETLWSVSQFGISEHAWTLLVSKSIAHETSYIHVGDFCRKRERTCCITTGFVTSKLTSKFPRRICRSLTTHCTDVVGSKPPLQSHCVNTFNKCTGFNRCTGMNWLHWF